MALDAIDHCRGLFRRTRFHACSRNRVAGRLNFPVFHCCSPLLLRPRGMDVCRVHHASLCVTCHRSGGARNSSRPAAGHSRQGLLANMARLRRCLPDRGSNPSGRHSRCLRLVFVCSLLRSSQSDNPPGILAETSPRPPQVREAKLWCNHKVLGSCFRNDASMKPANYPPMVKRRLFSGLKAECVRVR
jgi:hypothetical protein